MPTIKDIAKEAGVSHGTASNVLNGKGNVSVRKIQLVEDAARKLGYKINHKAKSLRSGATNAVSIIIPSIESDEHAQMYKGLDKTLTKLGYRTHLYTTYDLQHNEKNIINEIAEERVTGIVTISCLDNANAYYDEIDIPRENIIFINREIPNAEQFVSFDFAEAGAEIGAYIASKRYTSVGIFSDETKFSNEQLFINAIMEQVQGVAVKLLPVPLNQSYSQSFEFFKDELPEIIITSSLSKAYLFKNAHYYGSMQEAPQIVSLGAAGPVYDDQLTIYHQNYHLLGREIADLLVKQVTQSQQMDRRIIFKNNGMTDRTVTDTGASDKSLAILTVTSPTTDALLKLLPHFTKRTGINAVVTIKSYEEIHQILTNQTNVEPYDIIRMDMAWLPWLGKEVFQPLDQLDAHLDHLIQSLSQHMKDNYSQIEEHAYAIPFDPSIQMLFYRKDLFEDPKIKRMYFEKFKKQLAIPVDFEAFNEVARFFSAAYFNLSPTEYGTSVTLGKSELIALEFLTRYYAENGKIINDNGIYLDMKKAVTALASYLETVQAAQKLEAAWWGEAVNSFARGETAMVIGFMNHVSKIAHSDFGNVIGSASVPGQKPHLGGGVLGIAKHSNQIQEAVSFLGWVNSDEIAEQICLLGGTSANPNACNNQTITTLYPWLYEANRTNFSGIRETKYLDGKGFNTKQIERIIGLEIERALNNDITAEQIIASINNQLSVFSNHV